MVRHTWASALQHPYPRSVGAPYGRPLVDATPDALVGADIEHPGAKSQLLEGRQLPDDAVLGVSILKNTPAAKAVRASFAAAWANEFASHTSSGIVAYTHLPAGSSSVRSGGGPPSSFRALLNVEHGGAMWIQMTWPDLMDLRSHNTCHGFARSVSVMPRYPGTWES